MSIAVAEILDSNVLAFRSTAASLPKRVTNSDKNVLLRKLLESDGAVQGTTAYCYLEGGFYRGTDGGQHFYLVCQDLPYAAWYEVITVRISPLSSSEVWLSLGEQGLYRSNDSASTFEQVSTVEQAFIFSFGKNRNAQGVHPIYLAGKVKGLHNGIYVSHDVGKSWEMCSEVNGKHELQRHVVK